VRDRAHQERHNCDRETDSASECEGSDGRCLSATFPGSRITIHIGRGLAHLPVLSKGVNTGIDSTACPMSLTCAHVCDFFCGARRVRSGVDVATPHARTHARRQPKHAHAGHLCQKKITMLMGWESAREGKVR